MGSHLPPARTEFDIAGANCPWCFRETVQALRDEPGVDAVHGSITGQCLGVEHRDADVDRLLSVIREHLHADAVSESNPEHVLVRVDPRVADLQCTHGVEGAAEGGAT